MGKLEFKKTERDPKDVHADNVYAAMETGNHAAARLAIKTYGDAYPLSAARLASEVRREYGVAL